jgi:hypothetical protein
MRVKLIFHCPHCGSHSIRNSWKRVFQDRFLRILGLRPHRCHFCRSRFYLFRPNALYAFALALNRPPSRAAAIAVDAKLTPEAKRRWVIWDPLRNNRLW